MSAILNGTKSAVFPTIRQISLTTKSTDQSGDAKTEQMLASRPHIPTERRHKRLVTD